MNGKESNHNQNYNQAQNQDQEEDHDHNLLLVVQSLTNFVPNVGELSEMQMVTQTLPIHIQIYHPQNHKHCIRDLVQFLNFCKKTFSEVTQCVSNNNKFLFASQGTEGLTDQ